MLKGHFEWLVAWRYLRDPDRRTSAWLFIGLVLVALGAGVAWLAHGLPAPDTDSGPVPPAILYGRYVFFGGVILAVVGAWVAIFGACLTAFRLFTTISIFGVFFGTQALIFVLAVMSGFEGNLRRSILGNNAHVVITKGHKAFPRDPALERALFDEKGAPRIPGLVAASPFLMDEVILSGPKQHAGVYLKGIDPRNAFSRKLVGGNLRIGTVDNLIHPERLAYLSSATIPVPPPPEDGANLIDDDDALGPARPEPRPRAGDPATPRPRAGDPASPTRPRPRAGDPATPRPRAGDPLTPTRPRARASDPAPPTRPRLPPKLETGLLDDGVARTPPGADPDRPARRRRPSEPAGEPAVKTPPGPEPFPGAHVTEGPKVLPGIVLGRELAKTLGLRLGDSVDVISTKTQDIIVTGPMPRLKEFRVAGIFHSGHYEYDVKYAYVSLEVAQGFLRKKGRISGLELQTASAEAAREVAAAIQARIGTRTGYEVRPWQQIHRAIFSALQAEKIAMFVVLVIIVIVAAFSIVANLIMVVAEKSAEISVLRSMGARARSVLVIFLYEGVYIGLIGMATGVSMGIALSLGLRRFGFALDPEVYYIRAIPVAVDPTEVVVVAVAVLGISLLAALFPAVRAMGVRPVEGLRFK